MKNSAAARKRVQEQDEWMKKASEHKGKMTARLQAGLDRLWQELLLKERAS